MQVIEDVTKEWGDAEKIENMEGHIPGTNDRWGYWRILHTTKSDGTKVNRQAIAGEYNDGVLLYDIYAEDEKNEEQVMSKNDAIAELINSVKFDYYNPQTMYSPYYGTFINKKDTLILNENHMGTLIRKDKMNFVWGSS